MVKITNENTCSICTKKIGASVFVMYPSGVLVHFVCHKNQKANRTFTRPAVTIYWYGNLCLNNVNLSASSGQADVSSSEIYLDDF